MTDEEIVARVATLEKRITLMERKPTSHGSVTSPTVSPFYPPDRSPSIIKNPVGARSV
jgi:hypothetical protein